MIFFENDYARGAHPAVLSALVESNLQPLSGYGTDPVTARAADRIRAACEAPDADVRFLVGGTQTNLIVIDALLGPTEGVFSAVSGHIGVHEAGAIERTGHKVLPLPSHDGRIALEDLRAAVEAFDGDENGEHMVAPGMVYISHPTEFGTLYSKEELTALSAFCRRRGLILYLDGARLGCGLASPASDLTLPDVARLCDVFYIGGTKMGALCGEALVFSGHPAPARFLSLVKQHGALLAKGRLLGVQFDALFSDGLYFEIGRRAVTAAEKLKALLRRAGCAFWLETPTNQQFVIFENEALERLRRHVAVSFWERADATHTVVRLATDWSTTNEDLAALAEVLKTL